jgi:hypothetical protein
MRNLTRIPFLPAVAATLVLLAIAACSSVGSGGSTPAPQGSPTAPATAPLPAGSPTAAEVFETIDIGDQSGVAGERPQVFKLDTQAGWEELWSRHQANVSAAPGVPDVDFSREMVIAAVDQAEPSGGYRFEITGIEEVEGRLVVRVSKQIPGPDCIVTAVITQPFHVMRMAKSDLEPELAISEETYSCG